MSTEADTCRKYITPALQAAGWDDAPHSIAEQRTFTDGRIVPVGDKIRRLPCYCNKSTPIACGLL